VEQSFRWAEYGHQVFYAVLEEMLTYVNISEPSCFYVQDGHAKLNYKLPDCSVHIHMYRKQLDLRIIPDNGDSGAEVIDSIVNRYNLFGNHAKQRPVLSYNGIQRILNRTQDRFIQTQLSL